MINIWIYPTVAFLQKDFIPSAGQKVYNKVLKWPKIPCLFVMSLLVYVCVCIAIFTTTSLVLFIYIGYYTTFCQRQPRLYFVYSIFSSFSHHATFVSQTLLNYQMDYFLCSCILLQLIIQQILGYSIYSMGFAIKQAGVTAILFTNFGIRQFGIHSSVCRCKSTILQKRRKKRKM